MKIRAFFILLKQTSLTVLDFISLDKEARELYEARENDLRDRLGKLLSLKKGSGDAVRKKAIEASKKMIQDGLSLDLI